ncbi:hypothetical protein TgHK011_008185 [Trichoderma gracile]|nr:hypothetical protein TgHK011_008185 [Trichoderma gracile]
MTGQLCNVISANIPEFSRASTSPKLIALCTMRTFYSYSSSAHNPPSSVHPTAVRNPPPPAHRHPTTAAAGCSVLLASRRRPRKQKKRQKETRALETERCLATAVGFTSSLGRQTCCSQPEASSTTLSCRRLPRLAYAYSSRYITNPFLSSFSLIDHPLHCLLHISLHPSLRPTVRQLHHRSYIPRLKEQQSSIDSTLPEIIHLPRPLATRALACSVLDKLASALGAEPHICFISTRLSSSLWIDDRAIP